MKMVQVSSEAKASPTMTALTRISADRNIDHGDSSRSVGAAGFSGVTLSAGAAVALGAVAAGADGWRGGLGHRCWRLRRGNGLLLGERHRSKRHHGRRGQQFKNHSKHCRVYPSPR